MLSCERKLTGTMKEESNESFLKRLERFIGTVKSFFVRQRQGSKRVEAPFLGIGHGFQAKKIDEIRIICLLI